MLRRAVIPTSIVIASILFCLIAGEMVSRWLPMSKQHAVVLAKLSEQADHGSIDASPLGWKGIERTVDGVASRLLIVGDSFTEGVGVRDEALYTSQLALELQTGLSSYAGRGYGTLQELFALRKLLSQSRPNLVIIQACSNDLINNSLELEQRSYFQNAFQFRPYLEMNQVLLHYPSRFGGLRPLVERHSVFGWYLFSKLDLFAVNLVRAGWLTSVEAEIYRNGADWPPFNRAVLTTEQILRRMKDEIGDIPTFIFVADDVEPNRQAIEAAAIRVGFVVLAGVADQVRKSDTPGFRPYLPDKVHWSERGHALVGKILAEQIRTECRRLQTKCVPNLNPTRLPPEMP